MVNNGQKMKKFIKIHVEVGDEDFLVILDVWEKFFLPCQSLSLSRLRIKKFLIHFLRNKVGELNIFLILILKILWYSLEDDSLRGWATYINLIIGRMSSTENPLNNDTQNPISNLKNFFMNVDYFFSLVKIKGNSFL